ncbi:hypothetical protein NQZ79_g2256 [Umbelopsis isabellina]|nr:hypothetical protein NQZ79_g2256 [Umbelopsis isabellina]
MMCRSPSLHYATSQLSNDFQTTEHRYVNDKQHDMLQRVLELVEDLSARVDNMQSSKSERPPVDIFKPLPQVRYSGMSVSSIVKEEDSSPLPARHSLKSKQTLTDVHFTMKEEFKVDQVLDPLHPDVHANYIKVLESFSHEVLPDNLSWSANTSNDRISDSNGHHVDLRSRYAQAYLLLQCTQAAVRSPKKIDSLINAVNSIALYEMQRVVDIQNEFPYKRLPSDIDSNPHRQRDSSSTISSSFSQEKAHAPLFLRSSGQQSMESIELQPIANDPTDPAYMPLLEYKVQLMQSPSVPCFKTAGYIEDLNTPVFDHTDGEQPTYAIKKCQSALELTTFANLQGNEAYKEAAIGHPEDAVSNFFESGFDEPVKTPVVLCEAFEEPVERRNASEFLFALPRSQSSISSFRPISKSLSSVRLTKSGAGTKKSKVCTLFSKEEGVLC